MFGPNITGFAGIAEGAWSGSASSSAPSGAFYINAFQSSKVSFTSYSEKNVLKSSMADLPVALHYIAGEADFFADDELGPAVRKLMSAQTWREMERLDEDILNDSDEPADPATKLVCTVGPLVEWVY